MTQSLAAALAAFQAEMPTVPKSHRASVPTKSGGSYSYTYADLADVSAAVTPLLAKHGLAFSCCPRPADRGYELVGRLLHTSGESVEGSLPLNGTTPQEMGSSITYMRRYLLGALTGVVTDDDDDGRQAQVAAKRQQRPAETRPTEPTARDFILARHEGDFEAAIAGAATHCLTLPGDLEAYARILATEGTSDGPA